MKIRLSVCYPITRPDIGLKHQKEQKYVEVGTVLSHNEDFDNKAWNKHYARPEFTIRPHPTSNIGKIVQAMVDEKPCDIKIEESGYTHYFEVVPTSIDLGIKEYVLKVQAQRDATCEMEFNDV